MVHVTQGGPGGHTLGSPYNSLSNWGPGGVGAQELHGSRGQKAEAGPLGFPTSLRRSRNEQKPHVQLKALNTHEENPGEKQQPLPQT